MWSSGVGPGFTDVLRNLGGEVLKKVSENWKNPLDPLDREGMYARACCLRRAAVPFLGTIPGGTSTTRSLANRRPFARIDYGFFVGTSCEEGEKGSNLKDLTSFPFPQFPPKTLVIVHSRSATVPVYRYLSKICL